jgi:hypothetical protein
MPDTHSFLDFGFRISDFGFFSPKTGYSILDFEERHKYSGWVGGSSIEHRESTPGMRKKS